jgi:flagellar basal-body rod modification protein FlgD
LTTNTTINSSGTVSQTLLNTMNGTSGTSGTPSSSSSASSSSGTSGTDLQQTFLKLLVTQLQNQDPTNPMDSSQMTSQLAQINTVTGISQLNTTLSSLATQLNAGQSAQAAPLIGKTVLAPGNTVSVASGAAQGMGVSLAAAVSDVKVTIKDATGKIVNTLDLGAQQAGSVPVAWNGKDSTGATVADGNYTIVATGTINGQPATATTLTTSQVTSVTQQSNGTAGLTLSNGSTVPLTSVSQIL